MRVIDAERTGKNIKQLIKARKMTVDDVAKAMGLSPSAVYFWQSAWKMPSIDNLVILSGILNCGLDAIVVTKEV